jgi:hypothetical protein
MNESYSSSMALCQCYVLDEQIASWNEHNSNGKESTTNVWDQVYDLLMIGTKFTYYIGGQ